MIDRLLIAGILVGAALLVLFWKADDRFMHKVRQGIGITNSGQLTTNNIRTGAWDTDNK